MRVLTAADWAGAFGDDYADRNGRPEGRGLFWNTLLERYGISSVLEVGCGTGANLAEMLARERYGIDVNQRALDRVPAGIETWCESADEIPFGDGELDLVLTFGLLIHVPPDQIDAVMDEIVRVSGQFVFAGEYFGDDEVPYRGGSLWRRDYGEMYRARGLKQAETGQLSGWPWDDGVVDWWLMRR